MQFNNPCYLAWKTIGIVVMMMTVTIHNMIKEGKQFTSEEKAKAPTSNAKQQDEEVLEAWHSLPLTRLKMIVEAKQVLFAT